MKATATHCEGAPLAAPPKLSRACACIPTACTPASRRQRITTCNAGCRPRVRHCMHYSRAPTPAPQQARITLGRRAKPASSRCCLRDKEEQPTSSMGALSSMGDPVPVRSTACLNSTRPSPMGGRLPSLSVLRVSAHPCNPGTHTETPWRSADALCWLSARRLLHGSRAEGWHDGCRAPHGAAWAPERRRGARRRSVLPGPRGTEVRL